LDERALFYIQRPLIETRPRLLHPRHLKLLGMVSLGIGFTIAGVLIVFSAAMFAVTHQVIVCEYTILDSLPSAFLTSFPPDRRMKRAERAKELELATASLEVQVHQEVLVLQ